MIEKEGFDANSFPRVSSGRRKSVLKIPSQIVSISLLGLRIPFEPLLVDFLHGLICPKFDLNNPWNCRNKQVIQSLVGFLGYHLLLWHFVFQNRIEMEPERQDRVPCPSAGSMVLLYMYNDAVIIKGDVELNPAEHPIPKHHGSPGK